MKFSSHPRGFTRTPNLVSGFTLIELLVVIAIIALLANIVFTSLLGSKQKGNEAKAAANAVALQTALDLYQDANGDWPPVGQSVAAGSNPNINGGGWSNIYAVLKPYLASDPSPPSQDISGFHI
ncbi:MAG TPA: type II secretion system protein, partial [Candidatus Paceibacterota bacterium]|nr:type II secretion system protein [Candidatus Paceibacterota bacterium]